MVEDAGGGGAAADFEVKRELTRVVVENELVIKEESIMQTVKIIVWEVDGGWLGYLQQYPDYQTQGETLSDLKEHLKDLYKDLTSGEIPGVRHVEDLVVS